jgi:hypothetical protein
MIVKICEGLDVEDLNGEFLVLDADRTVVHRVSGASAALLGELLSGDSVEVDDDDVVRQLLGAGLLQVTDAHGRSRRQVLALTLAAGAAVGLASLALPSAAAAASVGGAAPDGGAGGGGSGPTYRVTVTQRCNPYRPRIFLEVNNPDNSYATYNWTVTGPFDGGTQSGASTGFTVINFTGWEEGETINWSVEVTAGAFGPASLNGSYLWGTAACL